MECTRDLGGCKVEGSFELLFRNRQHSLHPCHGTISFRRLFEVFEHFSDELRALDWSGPHRASKLHMCPQAIESGAARMRYGSKRPTYMEGRVALWTFLGDRRTGMRLELQVHLSTTFARLLYDPSQRLLVERLTTRTNIIGGSFAKRGA